jgi:3-hydroxyisobutyrate dehydrogenase-like beta-hydroxyacid dehydrogenase
VARVAVLHPGEMGSALGAALVGAGHEVRWLPAGRSPETRTRAEAAGLAEATGLAECDVVLSVCPPSSALDVASSTPGLSGIYVDANAISPMTAQAVASIVEERGAVYVDGGIIGAPPWESGTTRLYLSGPRATAVQELFRGTHVDARVLHQSPWAASAIKMAYASWTKISAALLVATDETAAALDVQQALRDEWALSQPQLVDRLAAARRSAESKGWRWEAEMREIAATFGEAGLPSGFGEAAADVFGRYQRPKSSP